jgi:exopolyphosphatase/guanosine-5'-triphosphate,3'-diphosphate pyrophosphatase
MRKFAVIDIGSNSVRLMFVADGKVLYKTLQTTRLGEGLAEEPLLKPEAIERSALAVAGFYKKAVEEGAETVLCFATAAVRTAENRQVFLDRVYALCGLPVDVISGEEEAEIGILGALGNRDGGVIDIGGASTEIVVKKDGALIYKKSVDIGVVRLKDMCGRDRDALERVANEASKQYGEIPLGDTVYAIGGTATTLTAQVLGLETYTSDAITGAEVSVNDMQAVTDKLLSMSVEEIAALPCMPKGRADVLTGGAVLFTVLMRNLGFTRIIASDRDNLEGYAIKKGLMV